MQHLSVAVCKNTIQRWHLLILFTKGQRKRVQARDGKRGSGIILNKAVIKRNKILLRFFAQWLSSIAQRTLREDATFLDFEWLQLGVCSYCPLCPPAVCLVCVCVWVALSPGQTDTHTFSSQSQRRMAHRKPWGFIRRISCRNLHQVTW